MTDTPGPTQGPPQGPPQKIAPAAHFADAQQYLERNRLRLEQARARAERARAELADNTATVRSTDGAVELTVNAGGQLMALNLGARAQGRTTLQLGEAIMATYRQACAAAAARTLDIVADLSGEDSVAVRSMKASLPAGVADAVEEIRREERMAR